MPLTLPPPSDPPPRSPEDRLLVALDPSPSVRNHASAMVARLAAEIGDVDVLDQIATAAENPEGVGSADVVERTGVSYRQLDTWTRAGYVHARGSGSGSRRVYAPREVVKIRIMFSIVSLFDMGPSTASLLADQILATGSAEIGGFRVTRKGLGS
jgi:hypothetical protein